MAGGLSLDAEMGQKGGPGEGNLLYLYDRKGLDVSADNKRVGDLHCFAGTVWFFARPGAGLEVTPSQCKTVAKCLKKM
jgi:hypothetical protein